MALKLERTEQPCSGHPNGSGDFSFDYYLKGIPLTGYRLKSRLNHDA